MVARDNLREHLQSQYEETSSPIPTQDWTITFPESHYISQAPAPEDPTCLWCGRVGYIHIQNFLGCATCHQTGRCGCLFVEVCPFRKGQSLQPEQPSPTPSLVDEGFDGYYGHFQHTIFSSSPASPEGCWRCRIDENNDPDWNGFC